LPQRRGRARGFSLTSFRAKFVLVVGGAVLVDLLLAGGIALWNVNRLSTNAMDEVGLGLEKANIEYLRNYIATTVERTDLLLDRYHAEVSGLAGSMQTFIDNPALADKLGQELQADGKVTTALAYNEAGNWWQNQPGEASAVTVWGYLARREQAADARCDEDRARKRRLQPRRPELPVGRPAEIADVLHRPAPEPNPAIDALQRPGLRLRQGLSRPQRDELVGFLFPRPLRDLAILARDAGGAPGRQSRSPCSLPISTASQARSSSASSSR
jgi:hypothetical protein